jgi:hypothetical protein
MENNKNNKSNNNNKTIKKNNSTEKASDLGDGVGAPTITGGWVVGTDGGAVVGAVVGDRVGVPHVKAKPSA